MTIILTLVGVLVFLISLLTTRSLKTSFRRLMTFTIVGLIIDILIWVAFMICLVAVN